VALLADIGPRGILDRVRATEEQTTMPQQLKGEVAIVTGAGSGFGRRIAMRLAAEGASVALFGRRRNALEAVAQEIEREEGRALALAGDVTVPEDVSRAARACEERLGPASVLVSSAGLPAPYGPLGVADPAAWWAAHAVHVRGPLLFLSAVLPGMRARRKGHIVFIASLAGVAPVRHLSAYAVGKCAQIRLMEHVPLENKELGISAFAIEPGTVTTDMTIATLNDPEARKWIPEGIAMLEASVAAQSDPAVHEAGFKRCCDMVADLVSGRFDVLSGRYLEPGDDFEALAAQARANREER
jgi:NAD(P)-dependent dehydrogenase (short-subunit alcohol dehydrogenase family)